MDGMQEQSVDIPLALEYRMKVNRLFAVKVLLRSLAGKTTRVTGAQVWPSVKLTTGQFRVTMMGGGGGVSSTAGAPVALAEHVHDVPLEAYQAAFGERYGEPTDTYTWNTVARKSIDAAAPYIRGEALGKSLTGEGYASGGPV